MHHTYSPASMVSLCGGALLIVVVSAYCVPRVHTHTPVCSAPQQLVLPGGLMTEGLPHLLKLSLSYRDASCDDLSDITWELLTRKLGLVVEVSRGVQWWRLCVRACVCVRLWEEDESPSGLMPDQAPRGQCTHI